MLRTVSSVQRIQKLHCIHPSRYLSTIMTDAKRSKADDNLNFANDFLTFLNEAATNFHASEACKKRLKAAGFTQLSEKDAWAIVRGGKYFFSRNDTSVIAFTVGSNYSATSGAFTVVGAHTDSPCLKVKTVATFKKGDALMLNTTPYGGGLWHTWFDRDLGLAGRAIIKGTDGQIDTKLFRIDEPVARIPNLAIHLTSGTERESFAPNLHEHAKAILSMDATFIDTLSTAEETETASRIHPALLRMVSEKLQIPSSDIEDLEMQLIDVQPACLSGATNEFLVGGRLDNLCSSYQSLRALIDCSNDTSVTEQSNVKMIMLFDHEEIGSATCVGAGSSMFMDTLTLINDCLSDGSKGSLMRALRNSLVISIDMAHAVHPNYAGKHDMTMAPKINGGLVIKHNANQRYATNAVSATLFRRIGKIAGVPMQEFSVRSDSGCGSTIGSIIATLTGILTVDCGTPQFSMHSIRETMGSRDVYTGYQHLKACFEHHPRVAAGLDSIKV